MSNPTIPSDINSWSKAQTAEYYTDELGWTLTPLIAGSKEPKYAKEQQYGVGRSDLLLDLNNGCNIGLFPSGTHVVLDLDSKSDHGKSVQKFLAQAGPRVQSLPRERTVGGVHIHLRIKDIEAVKSKHPKANKLFNKRVSSKVSGELFFGGTGYVVTSPSLHEAGTRYEWEIYGEIPEWSWREFTAAFGDFQPEKSERPADDATRARKFSGDLKTLDIIKLVTDLGWYHGPDAKRADAHMITCPWSSEHTGGAVTAAVFVPTNGQWPGFNCFHAHCSGRRLIDLLDKAEEVKPGLVDSCCTGTWKYEPGAKSAHGCPQVLLPAPGYQLNKTFVEEVADAVKDNLVWFSYQHEVVRIGNKHRTWINGQGEQVTVEERCLLPITSTEVESLLDAQVATGNIIEVELPNAGEVEAFVPCSISSTSAKMLINSPLLIDAIPQIDRLLDVPVPISTGSQWVLPRRDYNVDTRVFLDQDLKLRQMPLQDAKDLLEDISKDFCFADDDGGQSKCHWYARLITPMCRGIMGWEARMPLWTFTANRPRAGKDYLNGVAQTLYYRYAFEDSPLERSEETEKRITAALAAGRRSMHIANQQGSYFDDQALIAAITGTVWCSRRLGSNDSSSSLEYRNELEFSLSANMGLQFREDFIPRCRFIHLAYFEEDSNSRTFSRPDLHGYVRDNREFLLSAVYSLMVEWKRQGCPNGPTPFTTFPRWGQVVGGVMVACGYGDPCRVPSSASNPREEALSELFETTYEKHQDNWLDSKAVYSLVEGPDHQLGFWNRLESPKDKEKLAKDLKIYNRRTLRGITLYWQDGSKKLSRTKIRFVRAERASQFVPDVPDENGKNVGDVLGDVPKSTSSEGLTTETSPTSPNFATYAYREGNKSKNILGNDISKEPEVKTGTAGTSGTDKTDPTVEIPKSSPFLYVTDVARLQQAITVLQRNPGDPICVDIETYGPEDKQWGPASLDPYRGSIRLLSIKSVDSPVYLIDLDRVMFLDDLKQLLDSRECVGHNLSFDLSFLRYRFKVKPKSCFDTMVAARILANGTLEPNDLGSVLEAYLGIKLPKDQGSSDWGMTELTAEQLAYAANDVLHLLPLKAEMEKQLEASDLVVTASLENLLVPAVVDINLRGFYVDKAILEQMLTNAETAKSSAEAKLKQALNAPNLNVNSNPQLLNAFAAIGLSLNNTDKKETSKTEYQGHPAIAALIEYREVKAAYTEKIKSLLAAIRPDGRIHTRYDPLGTETGRFSCHAPNIQQIPSGRKAPIRKAFRAPEGKKLIKLDYNQMELRACASYTGETRLIKAYKDGADVHRLTASTLFGVPPEQVTDAQRSFGKTINFGFMYGMGAEGFARKLKSKENIDLSVEHAKSYRDKFFELYPGLRRWHQDCWQQVRTVPQPKEIRTPGLRRQLIKGGDDFNRFTNLTNTPIQGGCADAVKMAILALEAELPSGTGIVAMLHDELVIETDTSIAQEILSLAKQKMEECAGLVFKDVAMLVEGKIVDAWE